jgi:ribonuclease Z
MLGVQITFLGTAAGAPVADRNVSALAVRFAHGPWWLVDCGEATQHQVRRAGLRPVRLERILLTHLHGDHCFGLFGMLAAIGIAGRTDPVQVVGPPGLAELVATVQRIAAMHLPFPLDIVEIAPALQGRPVAFPGADRRAWSAVPLPLTHPIACLGWLLTEPPRPGRVHPERASALGLTDPAMLGRLQRGETVALPDGRRIEPGQILDPPPRQRRVLILGDTEDADACLPYAAGCDVVVREATFADAERAKARRWGHSTAAESGAFAARLGARALILTHFGGRAIAGASDGIAGLLAEAQAAAPGVAVAAAHDLWSWRLPE